MMAMAILNIYAWPDKIGVCNFSTVKKNAVSLLK